MEKVTFKIDGMTCEHCVRAVTNAVSGIPGTSGVSVSLKDGSASFVCDTAKTSIEAVKAAIVEEGYKVH